MQKEIKFGLIALVTAILAFVGLNYLSGSPYFGPPLKLHADYPNLSGLFAGNPVFIKGVQVGKVSQVELKVEEGFEESYIRVYMEFNKDYQIPDNSEAVVYSTGLLGEKGIEIKLPKEGTPSTNYLASGSEINGQIDPGMFGRAENLINDEGATIVKSGTEIVLSLAELAVQMTEIVENLQKAVNSGVYTEPLQGTLENIRATSANLALMSKDAAVIAEELQGISRNANSIVANVEGKNDDIQQIIENIEITSTSLAASSANIEQLMTSASSAVTSVDDVVSQLNEPDNTLGLLINQRDLYDSLQHTTANINNLLYDVQRHPGDYFDDIKIYLVVGGRRMLKEEEKRKKKLAEAEAKANE